MTERQGSSNILTDHDLKKCVRKLTKVKESARINKKYIDNLIVYINEPNVSIPRLINLLIERSQNASCYAVLRSLNTVHHLIYNGNNRLIQYLASSNCSFELGHFSGANSSQGSDVSKCIQWYAKYLYKNVTSYQILAFDFCKVKRSKEDEILSTMNSDKLLQVLKVLQPQLDTLFEFDCTFPLKNYEIKMVFLFILRDLGQLFSGYIDNFIDLLEKHYDINTIQGENVLDLYSKSIIKIGQLEKFYNVAKNNGIHKDEIPDLRIAINSLTDALSRLMDFINGKKSATDTPTEATRSTDKIYRKNSKNIKPDDIIEISDTNDLIDDTHSSNELIMCKSIEQSNTNIVLTDNLNIANVKLKPIDASNCNSVQKSKESKKCNTKSMIKTKLKYPLPLPISDKYKKNPSRPTLKISMNKIGNKIKLTWNMKMRSYMEDIEFYELYKTPITKQKIDSSNWKLIDKIKAQQLPMSYELNSFAKGNTYRLALRAVDIHRRGGLFEFTQISL